MVAILHHAIQFFFYVVLLLHAIIPVDCQLFRSCPNDFAKHPYCQRLVEVETHSCKNDEEKTFACSDTASNIVIELRQRYTS